MHVAVEGRPIRLTAGKLRTLLAALAMSAGRAVTVERLAEMVWCDRFPANSRRSLQNYAARLRSAMGDPLIETCPGGLLLRADADDVDALRFLRTLDRAAQAQDPDAERGLLDEALALWRSEPFEDVDSPWLRESEAPHLVERHLAALERRVDLDLAGGRKSRFTADLRKLTDRHPLRESLWLRLLRALVQDGRRAEVLDRYEELRARLAYELGVDPDPAIQRLYAEQLADHPKAYAEPRADHPRVPAVDGLSATGDPADRPAEDASLFAASPRRLPTATVDFIGRERDLASLAALVRAEPATAIVVDGMAGVGKTTLVVHNAHQVAARFPDGQLFIDLHGHTPGRAPVPPEDALDRLLRTLGVPADRIPPDPEDRVALYRGLLADRKVLLVLDDAAGEAQIRPLLPGSVSCCVLVTTRRRLTDLDGTRTLTLGVPSPADAIAMFTRVAGPHRVAGTAAGTLAETVARCELLPLAIRLAAIRLRSHPTWSVVRLLARLAPARRRLAELAAGERSVAVAIDMSYQSLPDRLQRAYRLLCGHASESFGADQAAALMGTDIMAAERLLEGLMDANLLQEPAPGRYAFHGLIRDHGAELAMEGGSGSAGRTAPLLHLPCPPRGALAEHNR
ncbi:AfsR/SARP family transcriptional regulator [Nonomuraea mesophila]|uniref:AfsR/SARP family transcriptional regulator n=1 Tax=Nonomuraea mesophila TaxID=2530382 RepID=UPI001049E431|nr:AfsR/SARP family transcriptional regulator [Nonomuraea mesophila]